MFEKGPGEGYHAAKVAALQIKATLKCRGVRYAGQIAGYIVEDRDGRAYGRARMARDAWNEALHCLKTGEPPSLER